MAPGALRSLFLAGFLVAGCRDVGEPIGRRARDGFEEAAFAPTTWLGNSFPADDDRRAVQRSISDLFVLPDGRVLTYSFYKGGAYRAVVYQEGRRVGRFASTTGFAGGQTITSDGQHVYVDDVLPDPPGPRISRATLDGEGPVESVAVPGAEIRGLAAGGGELYAADFAGGQILVFSTAPFGGRPVRTWRHARAGEMALAAGLLWVIQERDEGQPGRIDAFDPRTGTPRPERAITDVVDPRDLAVDGRGRLWVADSGPDYRLRVYRDLDTTPRLEATFGEPRGIFGGTPGRVGPRRLNAPNAVGVDAAGNVYVNHHMRGLGALLEAYAPSGERLWEVHALGAVFDNAALDPASDTDVYGKAFHFKMDWTQPPGREARLVGFTEGSFVHDRVPPPDPKERESPLSTTWGVRRIQGTLFVVTTQASGGALLSFHRFGDAGAGEIGRPVVVFGRRGGGAWPPGQPGGHLWIWRDGDGDGRFQAREYEASGAPVGTDADWWVDARGDVWVVTDAAPWEIWRFRMEGLDGRGVPVYVAARREAFRVPEPFGQNGAEAVAYDAPTDTLYLGGFTPDRPRDPGASLAYVGTVLARYERFTDPSRRRAWAIPLEQDQARDLVPRALGLEPGYVLVSYAVGAQVLVLDASSGRPLVTLRPGGEVRADRHVGLMSTGRRPNGELLAFVDDGFYRKVVIHRWNPRAPQGLAASATAGGVRLSWSAPIEGGARGYHVYRSASARVGYARLTTAPIEGTSHLDGAAPAGGRLFYRVSAVGEDGEAWSYETAVEVP